MPSVQKLPRSFYSRSTLQVAQDLIGKVLVRDFDGRRLSGTAAVARRARRVFARQGSCLSGRWSLVAGGWSQGTSATVVVDRRPEQSDIWHLPGGAANTEWHLTSDQRSERGSYVGCIAGALSRSEYVGGLEAAGFEDVSIEFTHEVADGMHGAIVKAVKTSDPRAKGLPVIQPAERAGCC